mmetsp:Transcript_79413/g.220843  ORF Transcript_79413/g.220843 Transcript_79413/m.220843 type:complete len:144 (-) Transcript_79413:81-512(-)
MCDPGSTVIGPTETAGGYGGVLEPGGKVVGGIVPGGGSKAWDVNLCELSCAPPAAEGYGEPERIDIAGGGCRQLCWPGKVCGGGLCDKCCAEAAHPDGMAPPPPNVAAEAANEDGCAPDCATTPPPPSTPEDGGRYDAACAPP